MDKIQKILVEAGRKDLAQEYYKKTSGKFLEEGPEKKTYIVSKSEITFWDKNEKEFHVPKSKETIKLLQEAGYKKGLFYPESSKKIAERIITFDKAQLDATINKMINMKPAELTKIFADYGYMDMKMESVKFEHFHFGDKELIAHYKVEWLDDEGELNETDNFVMWDGKKFTADVSGVSHPVK